MRRTRYRGRSSRARTGAVLLVAVARAALAQSEDEGRAALKVYVTGSNIPRADAESSLPVQVFTRARILASGAATVAEFLTRVPANILGANDALSIGGTAHPGLASANLRGIGAGSTLVLIDGRRVANYAFDGGAVDLNAIPLAAVARIEILKDGASAVYGTDAIAGVVNVILRKDVTGVEASVEGDFTEHGGGDSRQAVVTAGVGTLDADRYNIFATLSWRRDDALGAAARAFSRTGFRPDEGVNQLSAVSFPANVLGANDQLSIGDTRHPGLASANLRGIGAGSTLVLVNGRRVANYAFDGGAVDLNAIPLSAVARIEILKDGASAVYGTDAIAGVVNVILRRDFTGFEGSVDGSFTQHGGGDSRQAVITAGAGRLDTDRYNVFATVSWRRDDALGAAHRAFSGTGYRPD